MAHKIFINVNIDRTKEVTIKPGEAYLDIDGNPIFGTIIDEQTGEISQEPFLNETGEDDVSMVNKTEEELQVEKDIAIAEKAAQIQAKVEAYEAGKEYQRQHGGPAPVAEFDIKKICNEYQCQFEVVIRE